MTYFQLYHQAQLRAWSGQVNWVSDTIVATLHGSGYAPNLDTDAFVSSLTGELATGLGYTVGGIALSGKSASYVPAGSWPDIWSPLTPYSTGQVVRPANPAGLVFRCTAAGTSGASTPAWGAEGLTVTDGSVTWTAIGPGAVSLGASQVQWSGFSATFRYIVLSDRTPGSASAQPLLAIADLGGNSTGAGGNFTVPFDQAGAIVLWPA